METLKNLAHYTRLRKRAEIARVCDPANLEKAFSRKFLGDVLGFEVKKSKKQHKKYKKFFIDNCDEVMTNYYDRMLTHALGDLGKRAKSFAQPYVWKAVYGGGKTVNQFLQDTLMNLSPTGSLFAPATLEHVRKLIFGGKGRKERLTGLIELFIMFLTTYYLSNYDDNLMRRQLFSFLPDLDELFADIPVLENVWTRWALHIVTTQKLLDAFKVYLLSDPQVQPVEVEVKLKRVATPTKVHRRISTAVKSAAGQVQSAAHSTARRVSTAVKSAAGQVHSAAHSTASRLSNAVRSTAGRVPSAAKSVVKTAPRSRTQHSSYSSSDVWF